MGQKSYPSSGSRGAVRIGEQTIIQGGVQPSHLLAFTSESLTNAENELTSAGIEGTRAIHKLIRNTFVASGDLNVELAAAGYGMVLRHLLGDYVQGVSVDGSIRGRMKTDAVTAIAAVDTIVAKQVIELTVESSYDYEDSGKVAVVYRDANNVLTFADNTSAGYAYTGFAPHTISHIPVAGITASDSTHSGGTTDAVLLTLPQYVGYDGDLTNPEFNTQGGVLYVGPQRVRVRYFEADMSGTGTKVWLDPVDVDATNSGLGLVTLVLAAGMVVEGAPCLTGVGTDLGSAPVGKGRWIYQQSPDFAGAYLHHIEPGLRLPPAGLTIEIDRDAANFLYIGMKVGQGQFTFDASAIATATFSFLGIRERGITRLVADAVPGATTIYIEDGIAFPVAGGTITLGEETAITYTTKTLITSGPYDGYYSLSGIPASGAASIQRVHEKFVNVDCRSSRKASTTYSNNGLTPLMSFETIVRMDGGFEEVLNASLSINNQLDGEKFGLGSRETFGIVEGQRMVDGTLNFEFDDGKQYERYLSGDFFSVEFRSIMESADAEIGFTGVLSSLSMLCAKCKFNGTTPNIADQSFITHEMPFKAIWDTEYSTPEVVVQLTNAFQYDVAPAVASSSLKST
jgi:hypothetical protein